MTNEEIIIEVAKLDGIKQNFHWLHYPDQQIPDGYMLSDGTLVKELHSYLTSRDAIIPVIEKLSLPEQIQLMRHLHIEFRAGVASWTDFKILTASPRQLCIALLKATGKWKE